MKHRLHNLGFSLRSKKIKGNSKTKKKLCPPLKPKYIFNDNSSQLWIDNLCSTTILFLSFSRKIHSGKSLKTIMSYDFDKKCLFVKNNLNLSNITVNSTFFLKMHNGILLVF